MTAKVFFRGTVLTKCGYGGMMFVNSLTGEFKPFRCKSGRCERSECKAFFCKRRLAILCNLIPEHNLKTFFTLTLDRSLTLTQAWDMIAHIWSKMRKRLRREAKASGQEFRYVAVLEAHKDGFPHIHGFTNLYVWKDAWSWHWHKSGGGEHGSNVKGVTDTLKAGEYVNKELEVGKYVGKDNLCRALNEVAPKKRTMWRSKGLKTAKELEPKVASDWKLVRRDKYGKTDERKNLEAALQTVPRESAESSFSKLEASKEKSSRREESERVTSQESSVKQRDKTHQEYLRVYTMARSPLGVRIANHYEWLRE